MIIIIIITIILLLILLIIIIINIEKENKKQKRSKIKHNNYIITKCKLLLYGAVYARYSKGDDDADYDNMNVGRIKNVMITTTTTTLIIIRIIMMMMMIRKQISSNLIYLWDSLEHK